MANLLRRCFLFSAACVVAAPSVFAAPVPTHISLDGSLGHSGAVAGNGHVYTIAPWMGKRAGSNLFQSFGTFNLGTGDTADFQSGGAINILARVTGGSPSTIGGTLESNANLFFINPSGVLFTPTAQINVSGALTVSTGNYVTLSDGTIFHADTKHLQADAGLTSAPVSSFGFLKGVTPAPIAVQGANLANPAGPMQFVGGAFDATEGAKLSVNSTYLGIFSGGEVGDSGDATVPSLTAPGVTSYQSATGFSQMGAVQIANSAGGGALLQASRRSGQVILSGGQVTVAKGGGIVAPDGGSVTVDADSLSIDPGALVLADEGGAVTLLAGQSATIAGTVEATGLNSPTALGGSIVISASDLDLASTAVLDVSGNGGGGTLYLGGGPHGQDASVPNASTTTINLGAMIFADAVSAGSGGHVVVWSDDDTEYNGSISAQGGSVSGNGGDVEVSGAYLNFQGTVNTKAVAGSEGSLLLDPTDIDISTGANSGGLGMGPTFDNGTGSPSVLNTTTLENALANNDVTVETTPGSGATQGGSISVLNTVTWGSNHSLTLDADNAITVSASISNTYNDSNPPPTLELDAGSGGVTLNNNISLTKGSVTIDTTGAVSESSASVGITAKALTITNSAGISLIGDNSVSSVSITDDSPTSPTPPGITFDNSIALEITGMSETGGGDIVVTNTGALTIDSLSNTGGGDITVTNTGAITIPKTGSIAGSEDTIRLDSEGPGEDITVLGTITDEDSSSNPAGTVILTANGSGLSGGKGLITDNDEGAIVAENLETITSSGGVSLTNSADNNVLYFTATDDSSTGITFDDGGQYNEGPSSGVGLALTVGNNSAGNATTGVVENNSQGDVSIASTYVSSENVATTGEIVVASITGKNSITLSGGELTLDNSQASAVSGNSENMLIEGAISDPNNTVSLESSGEIFDNPNGSIVATTLETASVGETSLQNTADVVSKLVASNAGSGDLIFKLNSSVSGGNMLTITSISQSGSGDVSVTNNGEIEVSKGAGIITLGGGQLTLDNSQGVSSDIVILGAISDMASSQLAGTVLLNSQGEIEDTDGNPAHGQGSITAENLSTIATRGGVLLTNSSDNDVAYFTASDNSSTGITFDDGGRSTLTLGNNSSGNATTGIVESNSTGDVSIGNTSINSHTDVATTGAITVANLAGNNSISLAGGQLDLNNSIGAAKSGNSTGLTIEGAIFDPTSTVILDSSGMIDDNASAGPQGSIDAAQLETTSVGGTSLTSAANEVSEVQASNSGTGAITLNLNANSAQELTTSTISQSGSGDVSLTNNGEIEVAGDTSLAGGDLTFDNSTASNANAVAANILIKAAISDMASGKPAGTVNLNSGAAISDNEGGGPEGSIVADSLSTTSVGGLSLVNYQSNNVANFQASDGGNTSSGLFFYVNSPSLNVNSLSENSSVPVFIYNNKGGVTVTGPITAENADYVYMDSPFGNVNIDTNITTNYFYADGQNIYVDANVTANYVNLSGTNLLVNDQGVSGGAAVQAYSGITAYISGVTDINNGGTIELIPQSGAANGIATGAVYLFTGHLAIGDNGDSYFNSVNAGFSSGPSQVTPLATDGTPVMLGGTTYEAFDASCLSVNKGPIGYATPNSSNASGNVGLPTVDVLVYPKSGFSPLMPSNGLSLDGSLGETAGSIQASNYVSNSGGTIPAPAEPSVFDYQLTLANGYGDGVQIGDDYFISFSSFNTDSNEEIDFATPSGVTSNLENIIIRVTGGAANFSDDLNFSGFDTSSQNVHVYIIDPNGIDISSGSKGGITTGSGSNISLTVSDASSLSIGNVTIAMGTASALPLNLTGGNVTSLNYDSVTGRGGIFLNGGQLVQNSSSQALAGVQLIGSNITLQDTSVVSANAVDLLAVGNPSGGAVTISLDSNGLVSNPTTFEPKSDMGVISLAQQSAVTFSDDGPVPIQISGSTISLNDSYIIDQFEYNITPTVSPGGSYQAPTVELDADDVAIFSNDGGDSFISTINEGNAASDPSPSVTINANNLYIYETEQSGSRAVGILSFAEPPNVYNDILRSYVANRNYNGMGEYAGAGAGNAGAITLNIADNLWITGNGQISSASFGPGAGGAINIGSAGGNGVSAQYVQSLAVGGMLTIDYGDISVQASGGGSISASSAYGTIGETPTYESSGAAGSVTIYAGGVSVNGGTINSATAGPGDAGDLTFYVNGTYGGTGDFAGDFQATNGADIYAFSYANLYGFSTATSQEGGKAGTISINQADSSDQVGVDIDSSFVWAYNYSTMATAPYIQQGTVLQSTAAQGDIAINAQQLTLADGGYIQAGTEGVYPGGAISVSAEGVNISGSEIDSTTDGTGNAGDLTIDVDGTNGGTGDFVASNAYISAFSSGFAANGMGGKAGTITITQSNSKDINSLQPGQYGGVWIDNTLVRAYNYSASSPYSGTDLANAKGSVKIYTQQLTLSDDASVVADTEGIYPGGDVIIQETPNGGNVQLVQLLSGSSIMAGNFNSTSSLYPGGVIGVAGSISIASNNLTVEGQGSEISANAAATLNAVSLTTEVDGQTAPNAGNITIDAQNVTVESNGEISATTEGVYDGGSIDIPSLTDGSSAAQSVQILSGGSIDASTSGSGDGGSISIDAGSVTVSGASSEIAAGNSEPLGDTSAPIGRAGSISIACNSLTVEQGSEISTDASAIQNASSPSAANAGNITIDAAQNVTVESDAEIRATTEGIYNGGSVNIPSLTDGSSPAVSVKVLSGGSINASTSGSGNGGSISIMAGSVTVSGADQDDIAVAEISAGNSGATAGTPGSITIGCSSLLVDQEAIISTDAGANGAPNTSLLSTSGKIDISAQTITVQNDGEILATTEGSYNGGSIQLTGADGTEPATSVQVLSGGYINANTSGGGNGGSISIMAGSVTVSGIDEDGIYLSEISAGNSGSIAGAPGSITIGCSSLLVDQEAIISTDAGASQASAPLTTTNAGNITITAQAVTVQNFADIAATTDGAYDGGTIQITAANGAPAQSVQILSGGYVTANTSGQGNGGSIILQANSVVVSGYIPDPYDSSSYDYSELTAGNTSGSGAVGAAGSISIGCNSLLVDQLGIISTDAEANEAYAPLTITNTDGKVVPNAGNITISAQTVTVQNDGDILATTEGPYAGGTIKILGADGTGPATSVQILSGGFIDAGTSGAGPIVTTNGISTGGGNGGNIDIQAGSLQVSGLDQFGDQAQISAGTQGSGNGGTILIHVSGVAGSPGATGDVSVTDGGQITASSEGISVGDNSSQAGKIVIVQQNSQDLLSNPEAGLFIDGTNGSSISSSQDAVFSGATTSNGGTPGDIDIVAQQVTLKNQAHIDASTSNIYNGGSINILDTGLMLITGDSVIDASSGYMPPLGGGGLPGGNAGDISIDEFNGLPTNSGGFFSSVEQADPSFQNGPSPYLSRSLSNGSTYYYYSPVTKLDLFYGSTIRSDDSSGLKGGSILINANNVDIQHQSTVSAQDNFNPDSVLSLAGTGGSNITITASDNFYLNDYSKVLTDARYIQGGNITIDPQFVVLNHSIIDAFGGEGNGNVTIISQYVLAGDSKITASGQVTIDSILLDLSGALVALPEDLVDASKRLRESCARAIHHEFSSLIVVGRGGTETAPDELNADNSLDTATSSTLPTEKNQSKSQ